MPPGPGSKVPLVDPETHREAPAGQVLRGLLVRLRPALEAHGDWHTVQALTESALADGSAARRIRRTAQAEDLLGCVDMLIAETRGERAHRRSTQRSRGPAPAVAACGPHSSAGSGTPEAIGPG
ncbi:hypothetical protein GCM10020295_79800 [Streptomyces cinereospinus]